jgi:hypothetical protein
MVVNKLFLHSFNFKYLQGNNVKHWHGQLAISSKSNKGQSSFPQLDCLQKCLPNNQFIGPRLHRILAINLAQAKCHNPHVVRHLHPTAEMLAKKVPSNNLPIYRLPLALFPAIHPPQIPSKNIHPSHHRRPSLLQLDLRVPTIWRAINKVGKKIQK